MGSSKDQGPILLVREMRGIDTVAIAIGPYNSNIFPIQHNTRLFVRGLFESMQLASWVMI